MYGGRGGGLCTGGAVLGIVGGGVTFRFYLVNNAHALQTRYFKNGRCVRRGVQSSELSVGV